MRRPRTSEEDLREIWHCVQLYYTGIPQVEIARRLNLPKAKVCRLLKKALERNLVKIEFNPPRLLYLEGKMRERFGLFDAVITPSGEERYSRREVGIAAARFFERIVKEGARIAIGAGTALPAMIEALTPNKYKNLRIFPLAAIDFPEIIGFFTNDLVPAMKAKYMSSDVKAYSFQISPINRDLSEEEKEELLALHGIKELFEEAKNADIFLVGIDHVKYINPGVQRVLEHIGLDIQELQQKALGVINYYPFDSEKYLEFKPLTARLIAITPYHLREMSRRHGKHVIAIASGRGAIEAVRASLNPAIRCYDILITEQLIAEEILKE